MDRLRLILKWVSIGLGVACAVGCTCNRNDHYEESIHLHREAKLELLHGKNEQAHVHLAEANAKLSEKFDPCNARIAIYNNLGRSHAARGNFEKAINYYHDGITIFKKPPDAPCKHPFYAVLKNNLCESLSAGTASAGAAQECSEAFNANVLILSEGKTKLPADDIAWGLWNSARSDPGNNSSAANFYSVTSKFVSGPSGLDEAAVTDVYFQLGRYALLDGDFGSAGLFHQYAFDRRQSLGMDDSRIASSAAAVGQVMLCKQQFSNAEAHERWALRLRKARPDRLDIVKSYLGIALVLEKENKRQDAWSFYMQAYDTLAAKSPAVTGPSNDADPEFYPYNATKLVADLDKQLRMVPLSLHGIGRCVSAIAPNSQAVSLHEKALKWRMGLLGPDHPLTLQSLLETGSAHEDGGQPAEAEKFYQKALAIAETVLKQKRELTGVIQYALGRVNQKQGRADQAATYFAKASGNLAQPGTVLTEQYVKDREEFYHTMYFVDELQGPDARTVIAKDRPQHPRDHQTFSQFADKKHKEFDQLFQEDVAWGQRWKVFENLMDDPIDDLKHEIHGAQILFWRCFLLPDYMKGGKNMCN